MSVDRLKNKKIAAVLLGVLCLFSSLKASKDAVTGYPEYAMRIDISRLEQRYAPLKEMLAGQSPVGYVSDTNADPVTKNLTGRLLTQFSLYPILVEMGTKRQYIIGDFQHPRSDLNMPEFRNLTLVQDFGGGLMLFRKMQP